MQYRKMKQKYHRRKARRTRNNLKVLLRRYWNRFKAFWDEWGLSLDDFLGLIAALGVLIVLPCIATIIGSMFLA